MPTIDINDITIHYEIAGQGPAVLFVHGMCGDAEVWADQAARLSDRYTCVRYDRRGHTRSTRGDAPTSYALNTDDAAALIEALGLAPCLLVGSSGGAAISVDVLRRHGRLLRGAVLSEPPLFSMAPAAGRALLDDVLPLVERAIETGGPRAGVDAFFAKVCPGLWSTIDEARKDRYRANGDVGFAEVQAAPLAITADDLATVTTPVLVISGDESHPSFGAVAHELATALPDAALVELKGSGHVTYAEQPEQFANAVSVFAAELDRRAASGHGSLTRVTSRR